MAENKREEFDELEKRMRALECYHSVKIPARAWTILRLDGRGFSRFTEHLTKPFDTAFHENMLATCTMLLTELQATYVYTESDEISVLLPRNFDLFDRELEKLLSVSASVASSCFSLLNNRTAQFDSRVIVCAEDTQIFDYFRWRQLDATRCCLNSYCYWHMRNQGVSVGIATGALHGKGVEFKNEYLFKYGINFDTLPSWQRRGTGLYWELYEKDGYDPLREKTVKAIRRRVKTDTDLPRGDAYTSLLEETTIPLVVLPQVVDVSTKDVSHEACAIP